MKIFEALVISYGHNLSIWNHSEIPEVWVTSEVTNIHTIQPLLHSPFSSFFIFPLVHSHLLPSLLPTLFLPSSCSRSRHVWSEAGWRESNLPSPGGSFLYPFILISSIQTSALLKQYTNMVLQKWIRMKNTTTGGSVLTHNASNWQA